MDRCAGCRWQRLFWSDRCVTTENTVGKRSWPIAVGNALSKNKKPLELPTKLRKEYIHTHAITHTYIHSHIHTYHHMYKYIITEYKL